MATRTVQTKTTDTSRLDINIVESLSLDGSVPVNTGFSKSSTKSAGLYKSSNMFYKILYTEKGSNPVNKDEGTELMTLFQSNITDREVLYAFVDTQVSSALEQLQDYQSRASATDDELITNAVIDLFEFSDEGPTLDFSVDLHNAVGETATLQIPSIVLI